MWKCRLRLATTTGVGVGFVWKLKSLRPVIRLLVKVQRVVFGNSLLSVCWTVLCRPNTLVEKHLAISALLKWLMIRLESLLFLER